MTLLRRGDRRVMVPDVGSIEPEMLRAVLRSADISELEFYRRPVRSGIYPRTVPAGAPAVQSEAPAEPAPLRKIKGE